MNRKLLVLAFTFVAACAAGNDRGTDAPGLVPTDAGVDATDAHAETRPPDDGATFDVPPTETTKCPFCAPDGKSVLGCDGKLERTCAVGEACADGACVSACAAAKVNRSSVGCDYYATAMSAQGPAFGGCFVTFVANTSDKPTKITATFDGKALDLGKFARIPRGSGPKLTYEALDAAAGLPPNEVAILFLAHDLSPKGPSKAEGIPCPVTPAIETGAFHDMPIGGTVTPYQVVNTARARAFHLETSQPVVAYQMLPYGGGASRVTGASLLLPTSAWDTNYVAAQAYKSSWAYKMPPVLSIVAQEDDTKVTVLPTGEIRGWGSIVPAAVAGTPVTYTLSAGEVLQLTEGATTPELTGSPIQSNKPIGVLGGHYCLNVPHDRDYCDHAEQMIAPVRALGSEYVVVGHRDRIPGTVETHVHRLVGAVDGTTLTFDPKIEGAPTTIERGQIVELLTTGPFVVRSQDAAHPFLSFTYMTGSSTVGPHTWKGAGGIGDSDFVRLVAGQQYLKKYVFFTDPTYPDTNLVVVRKRGAAGFADVNLACLGKVGGFAPIGKGGTYEVAWVDLVKGNFEGQGGCDNGRHVMESNEPFGLYVWGWGGPETADGWCDAGQKGNTCDVSYAYAAGENAAQINTVVIEPKPK
ncbi:MAG: IgGFc-binding protein [Myxococcales bacterium]|nr:IgGFc-binding protein [Myxococcales bacterium]